MEISFDHRFIFVHVYRTGGQSVSQALRPHAFVPNRHLLRVPLVRKLGRTGLHQLQDYRLGHIKAKQLRDELDPEVFDGFFKFAFVRNPWDWHVSIYHYVRQRTDHPDHEQFKRMSGFEEFLDWRIHSEGAEQQREFVLDDDGELIVDFVGYHSTLARDFATVCRRVGIDATLPHRNESSHADFREYYTPETRALVAEAWRGDIDYFGFAFEDEPDHEPIVRTPAAALAGRPAA
jgi:hypothetical protein